MNGIEITHLDFDASTLQPALEDLKNKVNDKLGAESKSIAEDILAEAKARCPVETGRLRDSGYIEQTAEGYQVAFSAPYALVVHERPNPRTGESQFLLKAQEAVCGVNGENIKRRIDWNG